MMMMMGVRAASNSCCLIRYHLPHFRRRISIPCCILSVKRHAFFHSFVETVLQELHHTRRSRTRSRPGTNRLGLTKTTEQLEENPGKQTLRGGLLLEFKKDSERVLLAVAQKPDGKKNWMVSDQNGTSSSIKPQQITYIVPGIENFDHSQISEFMQKVEDNLDPSLLELAWAELLENNKSITVETLAEMIYGIAEPLESYCAHILLSKDEVYFSVLERQGFHSVYAPRSADQVEELLKRKLAKETSERELREFIQLLSAAKAMPLNAKPSRSTWTMDERIWNRIESLVAYAIDTYISDSQKKTAGTVVFFNLNKVNDSLKSNSHRVQKGAKELSLFAFRLT